jgi:hypothetical protein
LALVAVVSSLLTLTVVSATSKTFSKNLLRYFGVLAWTIRRKTTGLENSKVVLPEQALIQKTMFSSPVNFSH